MKQFDVVSGRSPDAPLLVVLSSHLIDLDLVIVAPLLEHVEKAIDIIDVKVEFEGRDLVIAVSELAAVTPRQLARVLGTLADYEDNIRRALDRLFTGF